MSGFIKKLFKKKEEEDIPEIKLPKEKKMYFDKTIKRWIIEGEEDEIRAQAERKTRAPPVGVRAGGGGNAGVAGGAGRPGAGRGGVGSRYASVLPQTESVVQNVSNNEGNVQSNQLIAVVNEDEQNNRVNEEKRADNEVDNRNRSIMTQGSLNYSTTNINSEQLNELNQKIRSLEEQLSLKDNEHFQHINKMKEDFQQNFFQLEKYYQEQLNNNIEFQNTLEETTSFEKSLLSKQISNLIEQSISFKIEKDRLEVNFILTLF